ncbi:MAG: Fic family protein [Oscillospiraceae bacterium]|nr:Fic family protein [Oscillospiraceae bacterium]
MSRNSPGRAFRWAKTTELHPILKSAVLHCEIEAIHPFAGVNTLEQKLLSRNNFTLPDKRG